MSDVDVSLPLLSDDALIDIASLLYAFPNAKARIPRHRHGHRHPREDTCRLARHAYSCEDVGMSGESVSWNAGLPLRMKVDRSIFAECTPDDVSDVVNSPGGGRCREFEYRIDQPVAHKNDPRQQITSGTTDPHYSLLTRNGAPQRVSQHFHAAL